MKLSKIVLMGATCFTLAACSGDNLEVTSPDNGNGSSYAALEINLPTVSGTGSRAVSYEQGIENEYAVTNGRVLVFRKAASEKAATFVCASDLAGMNWSTAAAGEVTTASRAVARLDNIDLNNNEAQYGALVILNYDNDFVFPSAEQTLSAWINTPQKSDMLLSADGKTFITMTSATKYAGSAKEPLLLADLDKAQIYQTESQAAASATPACTAFVQRNVAKVTFVTDASFKNKVSGGWYDGDGVKVTGWALDITNKTSYPLQVTEGLSTSYADIWKGGDKLNRFFGNGTAFQRVFWAKDPNYDKDVTTVDDTKAAFNVISVVNSLPAAIYALENTFDINHQLQGQTTRVVIKAEYTPKGIAAGSTFFLIGSNNKIWTLDALRAQILAVAKSRLNATDINVSLGDQMKKAGYHALTEVTIKKGDNRIADADYTAIAHLLGLPNATDKLIATYENGITYYVSRIKHFGDADTPWNIGQSTYGGDNLKYLGRYGIVRNNWYEVNVTNITRPGSPIVPVILPTVPDDENEYHISAQVNILSWAKRVYNAEL